VVIIDVEALVGDGKRECHCRMGFSHICRLIMISQVQEKCCNIKIISIDVDIFIIRKISYNREIGLKIWKLLKNSRNIV